MNGIAAHGSSCGDVVSLMALQGIGIIDHQHLLISVGHDHHLRALAQAFFRARLSLVVGALGAAFVVAYPSLNRGALPHIVERQRGQSQNKKYRKAKRKNFSHGRFFSFISSAAQSRGMAGIFNRPAGSIRTFRPNGRLGEL
jgi:hypothetical protein